MTNGEFNSLYIKARALKTLVKPLDFDSIKKVFYFVANDGRVEIASKEFNSKSIY